MSKQLDRLPEEVYVSAVLAERLEIASDLAITIHGVKPMLARDKPATPGIMLLVGWLYFTVFFRNPRPGAHVLKIVIRDRTWVQRFELTSLVLEHAGNSEVAARRIPISVSYPKDQCFLCVVVDDVDRAVIPLTVRPKTGE